MKKLIYTLLLLSGTHSFVYSDTTTSGALGLIKPTTGVIDLKRSYADKINENFNMVASTTNKLWTGGTTVYAPATETAVSTGLISGLTLFRSTAQTRIADIALSTGTIFTSLGSTFTALTSTGVALTNLTEAVRISTTSILEGNVTSYVRSLGTSTIEGGSLTIRGIGAGINIVGGGIRASTLTLSGLSISTGSRLTSLTNCDTVDTDASGNLICGIDDSGAPLTFSLVIATFSGAGADFEGSNQEPFVNAISSLSSHGGNIFIRKGTYTITAPFGLDRAVNLHFEKGAILTNSTSQQISVLAVSGTVTGLLTIRPQTVNDLGWNSTFFVRVNGGGVVDGLSVDMGTAQPSMGDNSNSLVLLTGNKPKITNYSITKDLKLVGTNERNGILMFRNSTAAIASHLDFETDSNQGFNIRFRDSSGTIIENFRWTISNPQNMLIGGAAGYTFRNTLRNGFVSVERDGGVANLFLLRESSETVMDNIIFETNKGNTVFISAGDGDQCHNCSFTNLTFHVSGTVSTCISIPANSTNNFIHGNKGTCGTFLSDSGSNTKRRDNFINGVLVTDD